MARLIGGGGRAAPENTFLDGRSPLLAIRGQDSEITTRGDDHGSSQGPTKECWTVGAGAGSDWVFRGRTGSCGRIEISTAQLDAGSRNADRG